MSQVFRLRISGTDGCPATAIVKVPAKNQVDRYRESANGSYVREVEVYRLLRDMQGGFQPKILAAICDTNTKTTALLIEDLGALPRPGEFSVENLRVTMSNLARVHSRFWGNDRLGANWWMRNEPHADIFEEDTDQFAPNWEMLASSSVLHPCNQSTVNRVGEYLSEHLLDVLRELDNRPRTLTHGDLHTANMMLRRTDSAVEPVLIDWQDAVYSGASSDVAKFLSTTLAPNDAETHFDDFIAAYHTALPSEIRATYPFATFRRDVMLALLGTFANYVIGATTRVPDDIGPGSLNESLRSVSSVINVVRPLEAL